MIGADRVALVGWLWFVFWIVGGNLIGRTRESTHGYRPSAT